eukprot:g1777.t1
MAAMNDSLFIVCGKMGNGRGGGGLYSVNPKDGSYTRLGAKTNWSNATCMTSLNGKLYIICGVMGGCNGGGGLYEVNAKNGEYKELSPGWRSATLMSTVTNKKQTALAIVRGSVNGCVTKDPSLTMMDPTSDPRAVDVANHKSKALKSLLASARAICSDEKHIFIYVRETPPILGRQLVLAERGRTMFSQNLAHKLPRDWADMPTGANLLIVPLSRADGMFRRIEAMLADSVPRAKVELISRIQNVYLWEQYCAPDPKQVYTGKNSAGFDPRLRHGASFSTKASSNGSSCGHDAGNGRKLLLFARVLCGFTKEYPSGMPTVKRAPDLPAGHKGGPGLYDSQYSQGKYCIHDKSQAYPAYVVEYSMLPELGIPSDDEMGNRRGGGSHYKRRSDFGSDEAYGDYVKKTLKPQMKVRAINAYERVKAGETGTYLRTNGGIPPCQCKWDIMGDTYWVFWENVAIIDDDASSSDSDHAMRCFRNVHLTCDYVYRSRRALSSASSTIPILTAETAARRMAEATPSAFRDGTFAFYSSVLEGITKDPAFMSIPVDDHMVHRGHAVFDTANVHEGSVYGLGFHVDRILSSAEKARIECRWSKEELIRIILETVAASGKRDDIFVRYWLSAGRGNFDVSPSACTGAQFYCVVHDDPPLHSASRTRESRSAVILTTDEVPEKPPLLATTKSNNYMINAIMAMEAEKRGAGLCLHADVATDTILESSVSSVAILTHDRILLAPTFDRILPSTTLQRVIDFTNTLVQEGLVKEFQQRPIQIREARDAAEMFELGGGWIHPITTLDNAPIGSGEVGPVFGRICDMLIDDLSNNAHTHAIP